MKSLFTLLGMPFFFAAALIHPRPVSPPPAASALSAECKAEVSIQVEGDPPQPTGNATLYCHNPCAQGCQSIPTSFAIQTSQGVVIVTGAACGCDGKLATSCCQVILSPPNGQGGPLPFGDCGTTECPVPGTCQVVGEQNPSTGAWEFVGRCQFIEHQSEDK